MSTHFPPTQVRHEVQDQGAWGSVAGALAPEVCRHRLPLSMMSPQWRSPGTSLASPAPVPVAQLAGASCAYLLSPALGTSVFAE